MKLPDSKFFILNCLCLDGFCAPGWVANGKFCYEFHTDDTDYKSWMDAKNACEQGKNSSSVGELVSITTELVYFFILYCIHLSKKSRLIEVIPIQS